MNSQISKSTDSLNTSTAI